MLLGNSGYQTIHYVCPFTVCSINSL